MSDFDNLILEKRQEILMTRKDFEEIANILKLMTHVPDEYRKEMALHFAQYFEKMNPNFNVVRFIGACGFKR